MIAVLKKLMLLVTFIWNITNSQYCFQPLAPNTRIHKDHPIDNVIGEVQSTVQTRRMTKPTSDKGFLGMCMKQKTHDNPETCLYCFVSYHRIVPTSIAKALSDSSWVEASRRTSAIQTSTIWILSDLLNGKKAIGTK
ncbi:hypothetical protein Tco_1262305 [Tanacetum coccineum]